MTTHIALSKVWHSTWLEGLCKTRARAVDIPTDSLAEHVVFSFDMELPQ